MLLPALVAELFGWYSTGTKPPLRPEINPNDVERLSRMYFTVLIAMTLQVVLSVGTIVAFYLKTRSIHRPIQASEAFRLVTNPNYLDEYLAKHHPLPASPKPPPLADYSVDNLIMDRHYIDTHPQSDIETKISQLQVTLRFKYNDDARVYSKVVEQCPLWQILLERQISQSLKTALFSFIAEFLNYDGYDGLLEATEYAKLVCTMINVVDDSLVGLLFNCLTAVSIQDFLMLCFDSWFEFPDSYKLELFSMLLVYSRSQLERSKQTYLLCKRKIASITDAPSDLSLIWDSIREPRGAMRRSCQGSHGALKDLTNSATTVSGS